MNTIDNRRNIELIREEILVAIGHFFEFLVDSESQINEFILLKPQYKAKLGLLLEIVLKRQSTLSPSFTLPEESLTSYDEVSGRNLYVQDLFLEYNNVKYKLRILWDEDQQIMMGFTFEDDKSLGFSIILVKNNKPEIPERIFTTDGYEYIRLGNDILDYRYVYENKNHMFIPFIEDI